MTSTPLDDSYDPYAGTLAGKPAIGSVTDGALRTADGGTRHYRLYVPSSLAAGEPAPLLVALHGGLGSSAQFAVNSGFDELAEANGFIVVYPDGIGARPDGSGPQTWNGGYCCGPAVRQDVDDVGFIRQLLDTLATDLSIDPARVFAAGHSNGAILAYRLACELSDRIVGIGVQAGSLGVDQCAPTQPVSVIHLHGTADTNTPIGGGKGSGVAGVEFRPARAAVEALAAADGCTSESRSATHPSNPDLTVATWSGCGSGAEVRYVVVAGATHAWMGRPAASAAAAAYVGEPYANLDASRAIWSFLAAHPRV
ncbi:MAG: PHB depolymerase family esterase [Actinomycetota bacterium]